MVGANRYGFPAGKWSFRAVAATGLLCTLILVYGAVATTANPMAIALAVGVVLGGMLLARLDIAIWLVLIGTLLINGAVSLALPSLTKTAWLFSLLGFFLLAGSLITQLMSRRNAVHLPGFITVLVVMMFASLITSFLGKGSAVEVLVGAKRAYQLWGLMVAIALMSRDSRSVARTGAWLKFLFVVALLQLPTALFERIVLVPKRVGMGGGVVPIDIVSGTFEASMEGGGSSSIMVIFLIIMLAYVFAAWKDKVIPSRRMALYAVLLGAPLFLGETKIAVVLLPMMFAMVFAGELRRNPFAAVGALIVGAGIAVCLGWIYLSVLATESVTPEQQLQKAIDYNFGSVGYYDRYSLNRTTATTFWFGEHGLENPVETVFGHGVGSSYAGAGSLVPGHLNSRYPFMAINLTALSTLLWDTGLLGTSLFLVAFLAAWRTAAGLQRQAPPGAGRAILVALRVSLACNGFALLYSNSMLSGMSHETILALTFGYLAWLVRVQQHDRRVTQL